MRVSLRHAGRAVSEQLAHDVEIYPTHDKPTGCRVPEGVEGRFHDPQRLEESPCVDAKSRRVHPREYWLGWP